MNCKDCIYRLGRVCDLHDDIISDYNEICANFEPYEDLEKLVED